ncbi:MAG TPA: [FeFe] hydrogenase, group A [Methylomusa anaerophila]|uniref:Periplasmic [Fe] hydrogenase large subunit n=1 Tax=Methylomusa anaerophila TaxID=1930071 RepID=A0A348AKX6_9FIRM|nr:[FeFe] hydrogenase, group A [Methylomusa anaerophila]BBB91724.1 periplasmic [Fe] hydrogenase large subunit [Methylomusa anaerophila]HML88539.1 [FeFe] hydrogenase, group A [Methylomusa anaerophila]
MKGFQTQELTRVVEIDRNTCKGCDSCKAFCPSAAIDGKYGAVHKIDSEKCINCGQCLVNCPFGAPKDTVDAVDRVIDKLKNKQVTVVGTIAPAVRVAIGEEFGMEPGSLVTEKLYGALKQAGFKVLDTNFTADQTIMEEGMELIGKIRHYALGEPAAGHLGPLPQFTSCCPAWIRYTELYYPELIPNLSSAKSPMMMAGALAKTYGAKEVWKIKPEDIYMVGIMPCTAKKFEASRPEFASAAHYWTTQGKSGQYPDVDVVLTTRDLARLFKKLNIDVKTVPEFTDQDNPLAQYSGAGTIFGNTGGVMEAALRTAYFVITGKELDILEFKPVRGLAGVKEADVPLKDAKTGKEITLKVAVAHGIKDNVKPLLEQVKAGKSPYHFIEVMNCPGGCVNGGGQPINPMGTSWLDKAKAILPWS